MIISGNGLIVLSLKKKRHETRRYSVFPRHETNNSSLFSHVERLEPENVLHISKIKNSLVSKMPKKTYLV